MRLDLSFDDCSGSTSLGVVDIAGSGIGNQLGAHFHISPDLANAELDATIVPVQCTSGTAQFVDLPALLWVATDTASPSADRPIGLRRDAIIHYPGIELGGAVLGLGAVT